MSIDTPPKELEDLSDPAAGAMDRDVRSDGARDGDAEDAEKRDEVETSVSPVMTALAAAASSAGAAWMVSSIFRDPLAHLVALGGVVIGIGVIIISYRVVRSNAVQYTAIPLALLVGSILIAPDARGGTLSTPALVVDALKTGGLLQPPISFDPGWRFILVVLFAVLASGAASMAISTGRPKLGVAMPLPFTLGAALIQPDSTEIISASIALICGVVAMTLAYGAELGGDSVTTASFETRRLVRGGLMAVGLAVLVLGLSRLNVLFPQPDRNHVVPPQRPQAPAQEPDRVLFSYKFSAPCHCPLRLGVIDVYSVKDGAWELPPYDATRLKRFTPPAALPGEKNPGKDAVRLTVTMGDAHGHSLPSIAGSGRVTSSDKVVLDYDPRAQAIRMSDRPVYAGYTYDVLAPAAPVDLGKRLAATGKPQKRLPGSVTNNEFLQAPPPPNEVVTLLSQYSQFAIKQNIPEDPFTKLQYVRQAFYDKVTAAGEGKPVDVSASRVAQLLNGGNASPYEITASEALLARWAGIPSRIGYGYFGGDKQPDGTFQIRPKHGSTWLEVYFQGYGWQAIVGVPPKAKPSTSTNPKNEQNIKASDELALVVYTPVELPTIQLLYEYVRFYLVYIAALLVPAVALVIGYPFLLKLLRSRRRRRWGIRNGYPGRIAVAYAEFRDAARDLTIGNGAATPIEFLEYFVDDPSHEELAWLVSRALWGDLRRDLREDDADAAERLASSSKRRMRRAQSGLNVALAAIARTSLKEPYTQEVPNLWPKRSARIPNPFARLTTRGSRVRGRALTAGATAILSIFMASCGLNAQAAARTMPGKLVPAAIGDLTFKREPAAEKQNRNAGSESLVSDSRVYSIHNGDVIEGSFQLSLFKPKVDTGDMNDESKTDFCIANPLSCTGHEAFKGIQASLGNGRFHRVHVLGERTYVMVLSDQFIYCWFPPNTQTLALMILRSQFTRPASDALRNSLVAYEQGKPPPPVSVPPEVFASPGSPGPGIGLPAGIESPPTASPAPQPTASTSPKP